MCLKDNWVWREVSSNSRTVSVPASLAQIFGPNPHRVGLIFCPIDTGGGGNALVTSDPGGGGGCILTSQVEFGMKEFFFARHGQLVQKAWFGSGGGPTPLSVTELILPSEFWPMFLGLVPVPSSS